MRHSSDRACSPPRKRARYDSYDDRYHGHHNHHSHHQVHDDHQREHREELDEFGRVKNTNKPVSPKRNEDQREECYMDRPMTKECACINL